MTLVYHTILVAVDGSEASKKDFKKSLIIAMNVTRDWDLLGIIPNLCGVLMANYAELVGI